jgi:hypothetical protein
MVVYSSTQKRTHELVMEGRKHQNRLCGLFAEHFTDSGPKVTRRGSSFLNHSLTIRIHNVATACIASVYYSASINEELQMLVTWV